MADQKLTEITAISDLQDTDIVYLVRDPSGSPLSRKMTVANLRTELLKAGSTAAFYFGDPDTDGTWRISRSGNNLIFERRVGGSYVQRGGITG